MNKTERIRSLKQLLEPNRIRILDYLHKSDSCVCEMVRELHIKHNLLSHHLSTLLDKGFLSNKRNGRHIIYRIKNDKMKCVDKILEFVTKQDSNCY